MTTSLTQLSYTAVADCLAISIPTDESDRLRAMAGWCADTAQSVRSVSSAVQDGGVAGWHGLAASEFIGSMGTIAPVSTATANWLEDCAGAATIYASTLSGSAARLTDLRRQLTNQLDAATISPISLDDQRLGGSGFVDQAGPATSLLVSQFQTELQTLTSARDRLIRQWTSQPPGLDPRRSGWAKLGHWAGNVGHWTTSAARPFLEFAEHPSAATFSAACSALITELSYAGMALDFICPPAAAAVWAIVALAAAAKLLTDTHRALHGDTTVNWRSFASDALAAIPAAGLSKALNPLRQAVSKKALAEFDRHMDAGQALIHMYGDTINLTVPPAGLAWHELRQDGHTLYKHGSYKAMWDRRAREPGVSYSSGYKDEVTADNITARAIIAKREAVRGFLTSTKCSVQIPHDFNIPVGLVHARGAADAVPGSRVIIHLAKDHDSPVGFRMVSSHVHL
ncbi:MAG: Type secretion protein Rhs [Frankiales bacterium]|nr:Type secretion protein Rhs [Frankiales bacterium]